MIELPDPLARRTTLRALVVVGLERVMVDGQTSAKERAKNLFAAMDKDSCMTAAKRLNRNEANAR